MTADEFDGTVLWGKNGSALVFDMRPFGKRQSEAVNYYLHDLIGKLENGEPRRSKAEPIVVWCDRGTCFEISTLESYRKLWRAGFPIKIEERRQT